MNKAKYIIILLLCLFSYLIFTQILFAENNLIVLKGSLNKTHQFTKKEKNGKQETEYAYLTFMLNGSNKFFILKLNVDSVKQGFNIFSGINKSLKYAGQIKVKIKKSDVLEVRPIVYEVYADEQNIYQRNKKPFSNTYLFVILGLNLLIMIILSIPRPYRNR
ncbi:hypothetical protein [Pedobacter sp.]|uniref:hypothetical protein n=1 Tax=Pedobacter sp. TaxID=1411316 RepID=UPI0031D9D601